VTGGVRRILFIHYTTPQILGGVEQVMSAHMAALLASRKEVAVLAGRGGVKPPGVRVIRVAEADSRHPAVERDLLA
jgi:hypothetical protein